MIVLTEEDIRKIANIINEMPYKYGSQLHIILAEAQNRKKEVVNE